MAALTHSHTHLHSHSHDHSTQDFGRAFLIGIVLNLIFVLTEVVYGISSKSLALLADAGHNFGDVIGLALAWLATWFAAKRPSSQYTYGFKSTTILSAMANALLLLIAIGGISWEAIQRLSNPGRVNEFVVMVVAGVGIVVNGITALLFVAGRKNDLNIRGAFLHMALDAVVSLGVVLSAALMLRTQWMWIDPLVSIAISLVIAIGTWSLLKDSFNLALQGVPRSIDSKKVHEFLAGQAGVASVHDLHIWGMSTTENALTAHLTMPKGHPGDEFLQRLAHELKDEYQVHHSTFQVDLGSCDASCASMES